MNKILTFDELNNLAEKLADYSCENTVIALRRFRYWKNYILSTFC